MTFGQRLKSARDNAGLSQEALAVLCGWPGESGQVRVHQYEAGKREPTLADIERLAERLGVPAAELAYGVSATLGFTREELALIQAWRTGSPETRALLANVVKLWKRPRWRRSPPPEEDDKK